MRENWFKLKVRYLWRRYKVEYYRYFNAITQLCWCCCGRMVTRWEANTIQKAVERQSGTDSIATHDEDDDDDELLWQAVTGWYGWCGLKNSRNEQKRPGHVNLFVIESLNEWITKPFAELRQSAPLVTTFLVITSGCSSRMAPGCNSIYVIL